MARTQRLLVCIQNENSMVRWQFCPFSPCGGKVLLDKVIWRFLAKDTDFTQVRLFNP